MSTNVWDMCCLMCGLVVGQIADGHFAHDPNCVLPLRQVGARVCCCRCGGSLVQELATTRQTVTIDITRTHSYNHAKYGKR